MASERTKELSSLLWFGAGCFLLGAMVTYREEVLTGAGDEDPLRNVCGQVGILLARGLLTQFGFAAFLVPLALVREGWRLFRRADARPITVRLFGILLFVPVLAAVLSDVLRGRSEWIPDPGGDVGLALSNLLTQQSGLGSLGGRIALGVLLLASFILYVDVLYSRSAGQALRWAQERGGVAAVLPWTGREPGGSRRPRRRAKAEDDLDEDAAENGAGTVDDLPAAVVPADDEIDVDAPGGAGVPVKSPVQATDAVEEDPTDAPPVDDGSADDHAADAAPEVVDPEPEPESGPARKKPLLKRLLERAKAAKGRKKKTVDPAQVDGVDLGPEQLDLPLPPIPRIAPVRRELPQMRSGVTPAPEAPSFKTVRPYKFPPIHLLDPPIVETNGDFARFTEDAARKLTAALKSFKVEARVVGVQRGPSITMLEVELAAGTKLTRLRALEDDLAMALAAQSVRIVAPIPGKSTAGIEIPNDQREIVRMSELLQWQGYNPQKYAIPIFLGKDSAGLPRVEDLARMPHLLVAGSTGSGKSVCLNTLIMSILFTRTPEQVKLILIDPKMVELSSFQNVPHLMCPVVTDMKRAAGILEWATDKMEERYALLHKVGVRNIYAYNKLGEEEVRHRLGDEFGDDFETTLPFIVIVMDELADLMLVHGKDVEQSITRLAQKSRAVGIHVLLATQRPSTNVITGLIKANLPTRIAFRVSSKIDSRVILDQNGADKLLGQGDMLYVPPGSADLARVQGCFVTDQEIKDVVEFLAKLGPPEYSRELIQKRSGGEDKDPAEIDDLYEQAADFVVETQRGSASLLQRRFAVGYTRASRLIDLMAGDGILGDFKGSQAREVLVTSLDELQRRREDQRKTRGAPEVSATKDHGAPDPDPAQQEMEA